MNTEDTQRVPSSAGKDQTSSSGFSTRAPAIQLPKGGGAIRGLGEKFAANPVTGTGSMSIPIATSPGRSGFGPQLSLSYDSGAGNGPFGFGWSLPLSSITRKTDKGLPRYLDAQESDVFMLSAAEDLVPLLVQNAQGKWEREELPDRIVNNVSYRVERYRPRVEGLFARIERWTNRDDPSDSFWRSISKDNITTWYGRTEESRISDPGDKSRIFSWLISETHDDKGNVVSYGYKEENSDGVNLSAAHERNRTQAGRSANRYLKRIRYGNHLPYFPELIDNQPWPTPPNDKQGGSKNWYFEVLFDYGEHDADTPLPGDSAEWACRNDPFSSCRAGFEVRTYRLCQRVLMFHHFPGEPGVESDCLVQSTDFEYSYEQDPQSASNPIYSRIVAVSQSGYKRDNGGYLKKSLPPLEFEYSEAEVDSTVHEIDPQSLENLPIGLDGSTYQWTDLHGEGIPGILTEQAGEWFYKRNLSPLLGGSSGETARPKVKFAPLEVVLSRPNAAFGAGAQIMDLAGDGQPDVVLMDGPSPGFYEHDEEEGWENFRAFTSRLNLDTRDPNLKFVDLDGDGHADVLITEDDALVWHASLAEAGFGPARRVAQALDEERGPRVVFADGTDSIHLADLSGDGLSDLVRIRNGEVCYWPNLGYGRFGARVSMDNAPWFDQPDVFDQKRVRLADIDGSGTTDIIYLHRDGVRLYFNQSGNGWSQPQSLRVFPRVDDLVSIVPTDLLGNGTACLVWSSPLPGDGRRPMRYVNLMGAGKPHLLIRTRNNLGAETRVEYASSTRFYLADKFAGTPWVTRLPFPVHCVEAVTVTDKWRKTRFSTRYSYHHGYFDGVEREFRGFGRVEQIDVESFGEFAAGNVDSPYISDDKTLYQPPVKTVTWFHTGALLDRERILSQFRQEYFPNWFEAANPDQTDVLGGFVENALPEPDLQTQDLDPDEWREALRACKGMALRQEVYELDVDALEQGVQQPVKLFSASCHNCNIQRLQPRNANRHAVFLVTESEAISYHYELDLQSSPVTPDPRISHTLNLNIDELGNVLQSVAVAYPRQGSHQDGSLPVGAETLIRQVQAETHLAYAEHRYTNDIDELDNRRLRVPCETLTYELTGIGWKKDRYFTLDELCCFRLSEEYQSSGEAANPNLIPVTASPYQQFPDQVTLQKRLVEHERMLFFAEDLQNPLPFRQLNRLGLPYETYRLALTDDLLNAVFGQEKLGDVQADLSNASLSGYLSGAALAARFDGVDTGGQYWVRSGIAGFADDAAEHFYLPERYTDAFGQTTVMAYDPLDLYLQTSSDPLGNTVAVTRFDYRVLAPSEMRDINDNLSEVVFDILGLPTVSAVKGKGDEGDSLAGFSDDLIDPDLDTRIAWFTQAYDEEQARLLLGNATGRHLYYFGETRAADGSIVYGAHPPCAAGIVRETHIAQLTPGEQTRMQLAFEYSDGGGAVIVNKNQAEPETAGGPLRWIASGKTVVNNKGKAVKQYEPYFTTAQTFEEPQEVGVTPVMYYDPVGRLIRTEAPDGSFSQVDFDPWQVTSYDASDTVMDSRWYDDRSPPDPAQALPKDPLTGKITATPDQRAAWLTALHQDTPAQTILDSLGRVVIAVAHNRVEDSAGTFIRGGKTYADEKYLTFTKLDAEGKPLWIRDARGNLVMQYIFPVKPTRAVDEPDQANPEAVPNGAVPCYDIAGSLLFQHGMDGGDRWTINDAAGQPFYSWDLNERESPDGTVVLEHRLYHATYDALRRPLEQRLRINSGDWQAIERLIYGEGQAKDKTRNLRGTLAVHFDQSGRMSTERLDFKGNVLEVTRRLATAFDAPVIHWPETVPPDSLEPETFTQRSEFDALNRMTRLYNWHRTPGRVAVYEPRYNERGALVAEELMVGADITQVDSATGRPYTATQRVPAIANVTYNAKGQRESIEYGNGAITTYDYDPETFRLIRLATTRSASPKQLQNLNYTYDPVGNITAIRDDAQQTVFFKNAMVEPHCAYEYDSLSRLVRASGRESAKYIGAPTRAGRKPEIGAFPLTDITLRNYTQVYRYDAVGNILRMRHQAGSTGSWTRDYAYAEDSNRLLSTWTGGDKSTAVNYGYDTHGSMLNLDNKPEEFRLHWDYRDMIHHVNFGGGGQAWYNYDAVKQRTRKRIERIGGVSEERLYLGGMELYRRSNASGVVEEIETVHLFDGSQRVLIVEDVLETDNEKLGVDTLYRYQLGNHIQSVGLELDEDGLMISYEEYHPYGTTAYQAMRDGKEMSAKRYRYTGMERDGETEFSYHGARYYAVWLGRWCSCDPNGIEASQNLFVYASDMPTSRIDTKGLDDEPGFFSRALDWVDRKVGPASDFGQKVSHGDYFGSSFVQDDKKLEKAQDVAMGVAVVATSVATGGVAAEAAAGLGGTGLASSVGSGVAGGVVGGASQRFLDTGVKTGSVKHALKAATKSDAVTKDILIGGVSGAAMHGAARLGQWSASSKPTAPTPKPTAPTPKPTTKSAAAKQLPAGPPAPKQLPAGPPAPKQLPAGPPAPKQLPAGPPAPKQLPPARLDLGPQGKATIPSTTVESRAVKEARVALARSGLREMGLTGHSAMGARGSGEGVDLPNLQFNQELQAAYPDVVALEVKFTASWSGLPANPIQQSKNLSQTLRYEAQSGERTGLVYYNVMFGLVIRVY